MKIPSGRNGVGSTPSPGHPPLYETVATDRWMRWAISLYLRGLGLMGLSSVRAVDLDLFHEMALFRQVLATEAVA